ncbi:MAG: hypothetical protein KDE04_18510 [Anaerolineales bacterium]|nr:hypothetical protein [Anaerolineales bacterium]MCB0031498.1 hypothetical protein [Anaerolineales bacterium]
MKRERIIRIAVYILCVMFTWPGDVARAQEGGGVDLRIRLRASDGSAVVDEPVVLQRLPDEEDITPACRTDTEGICTWHVRRGLYQLLFDRPLDAVSALAVAEGGLRGLGITVGDAPITYHFTFHSDDRVYFDAAPEAAVPAPIIPESDELHGGVPATTVPPTVTATLGALVPTAESTTIPVTTATPATPSSWRVLFFMGLGLVVGGGLHLWTRKRKQSDQPAKREVEDA